MIYLFYGLESFQIKEEITKIINKNKIDSVNIVNYTFDNNIKEIVDDASTVSLFSDKKAVIVNCDTMFDSTTNNLDYFEKYLNNPNPDTIFIIIINQDKIDTRRKTYKAIDKNGTVKAYNTKLNTLKYVNDLFSGYKLNNQTMQLFIKRLGNNPDILKSEAEKVMIYKDEDKIITDNDILKLTSNYIDINVFTFMDNIIFKNKKEALTTYHELLKINEEPIKIVMMLANNFRLMYQASNLSRMGYTEKDIMSITGKGSYPVQLAIQKGYKYDNKTLINILDELAELDYQMKTSDVDKNMALELFILKL